MKLFSRLMGQPLSAPPALPASPTADDRIAALKSASLETIVDSALRATDTPLQRAAQAQLAELMDAGALDVSGFIAQKDNLQERVGVVAQCRDPGHLPRALALISDPAQIAQLVATGSSSRLRQLAAETVHDPEQLRALLNRMRGKDNTVYRILKQKRDAANAASRHAAQLLEAVSVVCAALERHSQRAFDTLYTTTFEQLVMQWHALEAQPDADLEQRGNAAIDRCQQLIGEQQRQQALLDEQQAARQAAEAEREQILRAEQALAAAQAEAEAQRQQQLAAARAAQEQEHAEQLAAQQLALRQLGGLIRKANGVLGEGSTRVAAGLRRAIEEKLPAAAPMPLHLTRLLQQLDDRLTALKDWKDYAVAPKRIELIEEMEALAGVGIEPQALARQIQTLQQEWRTITKGISGDTSAEWERFHRAAEAAYQPCREYFEQQARVRAANLEQRRAVLARLTAFEAARNTEQPDWRLVSTVLREAPLEWRRHHPVERAANRIIEQDFDATMARLQATLADYHARNATERRSLIERARQLLALEDSSVAIDAVKQLQAQWKEAGAVPRDIDQQLWSEFREQCDAIFQRRQQAYTEYMAGLESSKAKAIALCEAVEQLASVDEAALRDAQTQLSAWRGAFDALEELPRADARALHNRFERAIDRYRALMAQQRVRDEQQSLLRLFEASRRVHACEWAVAQAIAPAELQQLKQAAEEFVAGNRLWPKGGLQIISRRLATADSETRTDSVAAEQALRTLCIRAEILGGLPTPAADESARRAYQLQKLVHGMGQGIVADDRDALALEWISVGAIAPLLYTELEARFTGALAQRRQ